MSRTLFKCVAIYDFLTTFKKTATLMPINIERSSDEDSDEV